MQEPLEISKQHLEILCRWALSECEIGGVLLGFGNRVECVVRLPNLLGSKKYYAWSSKRRKKMSESNLGLNVIGEFHSHPGIKDREMLSLPDSQYFSEDLYHILLTPSKRSIRCWRLNRNLKMTFKNEIELEVF